MTRHNMQAPILEIQHHIPLHLCLERGLGAELAVLIHDLDAARAEQLPSVRTRPHHRCPLLRLQPLRLLHLLGNRLRGKLRPELCVQFRRREHWCSDRQWGQLRRDGPRNQRQSDNRLRDSTRRHHGRDNGAPPAPRSHVHAAGRLRLPARRVAALRALRHAVRLRARDQTGADAQPGRFPLWLQWRGWWWFFSFSLRSQTGGVSVCAFFSREAVGDWKGKYHLLSSQLSWISPFSL
jgi:hypothetical protein